MQRGGGLITLPTSRATAPMWREPLRSTWRGQTLLSAPPPSSGGFALLQLLGMKDALSRATSRALAHNSTQYVHLVAEIAKRVFADRAEYARRPRLRRRADRAGSSIRPTSRDARQDVNRQRDLASAERRRQGSPKPRHTTHFSIVDRGATPSPTPTR